MIVRRLDPDRWLGFVVIPAKGTQACSIIRRAQVPAVAGMTTGDNNATMMPNESHRGSVVLPIRNSSTARAHWRPSRIAQTTSDWPRRMSPAANTLATDVR